MNHPNSGGHLFGLPSSGSDSMSATCRLKIIAWQEHAFSVVVEEQDIKTEQEHENKMAIFGVLRGGGFSRSQLRTGGHGKPYRIGGHLHQQRVARKQRRRARMVQQWD
jgi:hypothetical protein